MIFSVQWHYLKELPLLRQDVEVARRGGLRAPNRYHAGVESVTDNEGGSARMNTANVKRLGEQVRRFRARFVQGAAAAGTRIAGKAEPGAGSAFVRGATDVVAVAWSRSEVDWRHHRFDARHQD